MNLLTKPLFHTQKGGAVYSKSTLPQQKSKYIDRIALNCGTKIKNIILKTDVFVTCNTNLLNI
jgi:hypothetical protein